MPHLSGPCRYFFHHSYRVLSLQKYPSLAGKTGGTRIDKYRPLVMPLRLRGGLRNTVPRILVQPSCSALISAFALRTLTPNKHSPFISTLRISFRFGCGRPTQSKHQADNLAKLWLEFLSVRKPIAKIFGAVSRTRKSRANGNPNVLCVHELTGAWL